MNKSSFKLFPLTPFQLFKFLKFILGKQIYTLFAYAGLMGIVYALTLLPPIIIGNLTNLITSKNLETAEYRIYLLCIVLAAIVILEALIRGVAKPALAKLGFYAAYEAKVLAFERLISKSIEWHDDDLAGNKIQRLTAGGNSLVCLLDQLHSNVLPVSITFFGVIFSFLFFDLFYVFYAFGFIACFWSIQLFFLKKEHKLITAAKEASEKSFGEYTESAGNILTIKALNVEEQIAAKIAIREKTSRDLNIEQKRISHKKYSYFKIFDALAYSCFVAITAHDVIHHAISAGAFITLVAYFRSLDTAVRETVSFMDSLIENWITVGRMTKIFFAEDAVVNGQQDFPKNWQVLKLNAVTCSYKNGTIGLKDFNLTIKRGEHIGVVGVSGSGKSTLGKALIGTMPIQSGTYSIDDIEFKNISGRERAEKMAIVLQDSELFNMSLAENIRLMREVSPEKIQKAIEVAALSPVVKKLKAGINELIGEKGYRLSGGERQRLGVARAICKNPEILILDEASSALDSKTEANMHQNLRQQLSGQTIISIAHRLSTLSQVDRIIVIENGQIAEEGRPEDLVSDFDSKYSTLLREQLNNEPNENKVDLSS